MTPWTAAHQAYLSFTISWSLLRLMSIEIVMSSNHLILRCPLSSFAFNLYQHQGLFQWVCSSYQIAKVLEFQLQHQSFQWIFRVDFLWDWLVWSCSLRDTPTPQFKGINLWCSAFFMVQLSHPYMTFGKTIVLIIWIFFGKIIYLLYNMLSRFAMAFLQEGRIF